MKQPISVGTCSWQNTEEQNCLITQHDISFRENCRKQMHCDKIKKTYLCKCKKMNLGLLNVRGNIVNLRSWVSNVTGEEKANGPTGTWTQDMTTLTTELPSNNVVLWQFPPAWLDLSPNLLGTNETVLLLLEPRAWTPPPHTHTHRPPNVTGGKST